MNPQNPSSENENSRQSPKDVLANLRTYYKNEEILRNIELHVNFETEETFFTSLQTFLNDKEDAHIIDMLFNSSIDGISEEMDLYKRAEQSIIKTVDRPVFLINNDQIDIAITTIWEEHIAEHIDTISKVIPAVGRIEMTGDDRREWVGTGWLLKNTNIIVTNRHVADDFTLRKDGLLQIRADWMGDKYGVRIDFKEEHATNEELEFDIKEVIYMAKESELDIALLRVEKQNHNGDQLPEGLAISYEIPNLKKDIYVVGYPACYEDKGLRDRHFNGTSEIKQFAPGAFFKTDISKFIYKHDCTTWKGNSGSPIIDFTSGKVLGIHYAGTNESRKEFRANYAVSVLALVEILAALDIFYNH